MHYDLCYMLYACQSFLNEKHPKAPINPYGRSKWMVEQILEDYDRAYGLKSICLRYFNAAGADPDGKLGERHDPEDGTCMRDYIHVADLCQAHWLAIQHLQSTGESGRYNLGNGNGFSVQQVIDVCRQVGGRAIAVIVGERREGDPAVLVADSSRARSELGWQPYYADLDSIVSHAWIWEESRNVKDD